MKLTKLLSVLSALVFCAGVVIVARAQQPGAIDKRNTITSGAERRNALIAEQTKSAEESIARLQQSLKSLQQAQQKSRGQVVQYTLSLYGFDRKVQNAVAEFVNAQEAALEPLRAQSSRIAQVAAKTPADAQMKTLLAELRASTEKEKARRAAAVKSLDAVIGFSKDLRLEATLTSLGIIGDETLILAGVDLNRMGALAKSASMSSK